MFVALLGATGGVPTKPQNWVKTLGQGKH
jgi:hypothetical protein